MRLSVKRGAPRYTHAVIATRHDGYQATSRHTSKELAEARAEQMRGMRLADGSPIWVAAEVTDKPYRWMK